MMNKLQTRDFLKTVKLLHDNDCISNTIIVGSWAEYLYIETGVLPSYAASVSTLDLDVLVKNLKYPRQEVNLPELARAEGYLIESERLTGITKLLLPGSLEVEFLLSKRGAGNEKALKTNLGVTAQTLRHMELLLTNTIVVDYFGMSIEIPSPEAYVLHKMIINKDRKQKAEKDRLAINEIFQHLDISKFTNLIETLSKRDKKEAQKYISQYISPAKEEAGRIEEAKSKIFK
jgi:hypothetical protein